MIHFTSDTHFYHKKMVEERGFESVEEMNRLLVLGWNEEVGHGDIVYHLGDVSFAGWRLTQEIVEQLNGHIMIVPGNHDTESELKRLKSAWGPVTILPPLHKVKIPSTGDAEPIRLVLCHYPMRSWDKAHYGAIHLHGHSHGSCLPIGRMLDVGVDGPISAMRPVSLPLVMAYMRDEQFVKVDHHG